MLLAEIDPAVGVCVVEKPVGAGFVFTDVEGDLLIERVAGFGVKAHGVHSLQRKAPAALVDASALVTEAEDSLTRMTECIVGRAFAKLAGEVIGESGTVRIEEALFCPGLDAEVFLFHREIQAA